MGDDLSPQKARIRSATCRSRNHRPHVPVPAAFRCCAEAPGLSSPVSNHSIVLPNSNAILNCDFDRPTFYGALPGQGRWSWLDVARLCPPLVALVIMLDVI